MKYLKRLSVKDFDVLLNKMGYTLKYKDENISSNKSFLALHDNCIMINCIKIPTKTDSVAFEFLTRKTSNLPILTQSGNYSAFDTFIRLTDYEATEYMSKDNKDLSIHLREYLSLTFGEEYVKDLAQINIKEQIM